MSSSAVSPAVDLGARDHRQPEQAKRVRTRPPVRAGGPGQQFRHADTRFPTSLYEFFRFVSRNSAFGPGRAEGEPAPHARPAASCPFPGSGFFDLSDGYVVTMITFVRNATMGAEVCSMDGRQFEAEVSQGKRSAQRILALLKIDGPRSGFSLI